MFAMKASGVLAGIAVLGLVAAAIGQEPPAKLEPFRSAEGNFSVLLPGTPTGETVPIADSKGAPAEQVQFALNRGNGAYLVSYQDNPGLKDAGAEQAERALVVG